MKILMIDDDQLLAELVKERLVTEGFEVCLAFDGLSGIECMIKEIPDLILLDIMMPGIDGYEVCKKLKESPATACLPIVFISARNAQEDIDKAMQLGADDYIVKPFDTLALGERLKSVYKKVSKKDKNS